MHPRLAAVAAEQGGVFSRAQALESGYADEEIARLLRREWRRVRRGVYIERGLYDEADDRERHRLGLHALRLRLPDLGTVSHVSAAVLHGLELYEPDLAVLHVTRPRLRASRHEADVQHHLAAVPGHHRTVVDGFAATTLARTAVDVARTASFARAVATADSALRAGAPAEDLTAVMAYCGQWPGARTASRAVAFADGRAESVGESLTRVLLAEHGLPEPELQVPISDEDGLVGFVDFLLRAERTVVEFDGRLKYRVPPGADPDLAGEVVWAEKRREDRLRRCGLVVERVVWSDLFRGAATAGRIRAACARRRPGSRPA